VSLVLTYDRVLDPGATCHFDLGALCYGIVLAAWDRGFGTVINGQGITRSDIVREVAAIPDDEVIRPASRWAIPTIRFRPTACAPTASRSTISCVLSALRSRRRP